MFLKTRYTILEKIFICSLIMLHLTLILPLSDVFPLPKTLTRSEVFAATNNPPTIEPMSPITKKEGQTLVLEPVTYDPDGDPVELSYEALDTPEVQFGADGSWVIPYDFTGQNETRMFTAKITASDGELNSSINVDITIENENATPTVDISLNPSFVNPDENFTIHVEATDLDGDTLTYVLEENGTDITPNPIPDPFDMTMSKSAPGGYSYTVTVTDPSEDSAFDIAYLEVIDDSDGLDDIFPISGDFNGDGLTDIGSWDKRNDTWAVSFSEEGEFNNVRTWTDIFGEYKYGKDRTYSVTGDFNGDGLTDIALYNTGGKDKDNNDTEGGTWKFAFSNGDSFNYLESWDVSKFGGGNCAPLIGDFNGDGITDIGYSAPVSNDGCFWIKLAKEDKSGFESTTIPYQTNLGNSATYSGDFNGDGLADILAFNRNSGNWNVLLLQDITSLQLIDRMREPGVTGETIINNTSSGTYTGTWESTFDGDFSEYVGFYSGGETSRGVNITSTYHFDAMDVAFFTYSCESQSGVAEDGHHDNNWYVSLRVDDEWLQIGSGSYASGEVTVSTGWTNVTGAKIYTYGAADYYKKATCVCGGYHYEIQIWRSPDTFESNEGLAAFTDGESWKSGFGAGKDPILTDYNHDGKTDIGYFNSDNGEWHYALSDGTQFNEVSGAGWPTSFGQGSDILPSGGDFNGDGIGDAAIFHKDLHGLLNKWETIPHDSNQPDLLVSVNNGIGGTTDIEYVVSTQFDNLGDDGKPVLPFPVHVVERVTKSDGMDHSYEINYTYQDGMFEPDSREFRGFEYVKVIDSEGTVKETQFNQDDIYKGRPHEERVSDAYGRTYSSVQYVWDSTIKHNGSVTFPYLVSKTSTLYNFKDGTTKDIKTMYNIPDDYGNVRRIDELGFVDDPTDDRYTLIDYEYNLDKYIVGKPKHTTIKKGTDTLSEMWYTYDSFGSLKEEKKWLNTGSDPVTKFKYDYEADPTKHCGNIVEVEDALGHKTTTEYNSDYEYTFPTKVTNALGHTQQFTYDYKTGQILTSTDPNSQVTRTVYDGFGRIKKIIGPNDTEASPGIEYFYYLESGFPVKIKTVTKVDETGPITHTTSYAFIDGLGRTIEVRTPAEDSTQQIVSGIAEFDSRGQVKRKYLPYFEPVSSEYIRPTYGKYIEYIYDHIGRVIQTISPDGTVSYVQYEGWIVTTIDGNGHKIKSEKDAYGRLKTVTEYNKGAAYITDYVYDTLGNLTDTYDSASTILAERNHTHIEYDTLGRKISMNDPDMHKWYYGYDAVGNLIWQEDAKGQILGFKYDEINRLKIKGQIAARGNVPTGGVIYEYDTVTPENPYATGRLVRVVDTSGTTEFFYDKLGREERTKKTIDTTFYEISRTYDSIDRLKTVTYPDGEEITYTYNNAGGIETVIGDQTYISKIDYNANGQMALVKYGNETHTDYSYNPQTLRLEHLTTQKSGQPLLQDLSYTFDNVGNVLSITDISDTGTNSQTFTYDDLNRLKTATNTSTGGGYSAIAYDYNSIGNMTKKGDMTMEYGEGTAGPHAVTAYTLNATRYTISYDDNGNMVSKEQGISVKTFEYNVENRLVEAAPMGEYISDYTIELDPGWNFISIPVIPTQDIAAILKSSGITKAQVSRYNADKQEWENLAYEKEEDLREFCNFSTFEYGRGYEIYVDTASTLTVSGVTPLTAKTLELNPEWNLIASPTTSTDGIAIGDVLPDITYDGIYEREGDAYVPVTTTLQSGKAYFLHIPTPTQQTWNIPLEKIDQDTITYAYDGDGGRVRKTTANETVTYIGSSFEVSQLTGEPVSRFKKHIFLGSTRICTVEFDGEFDVDGHIVQIPETEDTRYFHQDHIGSSNIITNETGEIAKLVEYKPYGLTARVPVEYNHYETDCLFTGQLFDTHIALYYYGARYYDPDLGRFISPDTIVPYPSDPQSFNRYAYARNNPIRYIDPTGHSWWSSFWSFVAGLVGAVVGVVASFYLGPVIGGMIGGAVSGAILGAIDGGLGGALKGAAWGAGIGGILGAGYAGFESIGIGGYFLAGAAIGGAAYAGATGGLEGLGDFAAGGVGAFYGYTLGNALVNPSAYAQTQTETQGALSEAETKEIKEQLSAGQFEDPVGNSGSDTPSVLKNHEKAKIIKNQAVKGKVGKGNNPKITPDTTTLTKAEIRATARAYYRQKSFLSLMVDKVVIGAKILIAWFFPVAGAGLVAHEAINAETQAQTGRNTFIHIKESLSRPRKHTHGEHGYLFH